jgi:membrane protease YdiL (CAAX protease family)
MGGITSYNCGTPIGLASHRVYNGNKQLDEEVDMKSAAEFESNQIAADEHGAPLSLSVGSVLASRDLVAFLAVSFGLAWVIWTLSWLAGFLTNPALATAILSLTMFAPSLAAVAANWPLSRAKISTWGWARGDWRYYLLTLAVIPTVFVAGAAVAMAVGIQQINIEPAVQSLADQFGVAAPEPAILLLILIIPTMTIAPFVNTIFALGEELGWRGYLLGRLLPLGGAQAAVISGMIWGIWHAPIIAMGHNYPGHPVVGPPLMVVLSVIYGVILSWLRLRSGSVVVAGLAHGAMNAEAGIVLLLLTPANPTLGAPAGVAALVPAAILVIWLIWSGRLKAR